MRSYYSENSRKYTTSVDAPDAEYIPMENPNFNQGFVVRKRKVLYFINYRVLSNFTFHES